MVRKIRNPEGVLDSITAALDPEVIRKYSENETRDEHGRWTAGGSAGGTGGNGAAPGGAPLDWLHGATDRGTDGGASDRPVSGAPSSVDDDNQPGGAPLDWLRPPPGASPDAGSKGSYTERLGQNEWSHPTERAGHITVAQSFEGGVPGKSVLIVGAAEKGTTSGGHMTEVDASTFHSLARAQGANEAASNYGAAHASHVVASQLLSGKSPREIAHAIDRSYDMHSGQPAIAPHYSDEKPKVVPQRASKTATPARRTDPAAAGDPQDNYPEVPNHLFLDQKNRKYPVDTVEHVDAASRFLARVHNRAFYSAEELKAMEDELAKRKAELGIGDAGADTASKRAIAEATKSVEAILAASGLEVSDEARQKMVNALLTKERLDAMTPVEDVIGFLDLVDATEDEGDYAAAVDALGRNLLQRSEIATKAAGEKNYKQALHDRLAKDESVFCSCGGKDDAETKSRMHNPSHAASEPPKHDHGTQSPGPSHSAPYEGAEAGGRSGGEEACPKCGNAVARGASRCEECGHVLATHTPGEKPGHATGGQSVDADDQGATQDPAEAARDGDDPSAKKGITPETVNRQAEGSETAAGSQTPPTPSPDAATAAELGQAKVVIARQQAELRRVKDAAREEAEAREELERDVTRLKQMNARTDHKSIGDSRKEEPVRKSQRRYSVGDPRWTPDLSVLGPEINPQ